MKTLTSSTSSATISAPPDYYDLVSLGDIGPHVPGHALVGIDPARVRLLPTPQGALPYPPARDGADS